MKVMLDRYIVSPGGHLALVVFSTDSGQKYSWLLERGDPTGMMGKLCEDGRENHIEVTVFFLQPMRFVTLGKQPEYDFDIVDSSHERTSCIRIECYHDALKALCIDLMRDMKFNTSEKPVDNVYDFLTQP